MVAQGEKTKSKKPNTNKRTGQVNMNFMALWTLHQIKHLTSLRGWPENACWGRSRTAVTDPASQLPHYPCTNLGAGGHKALRGHTLISFTKVINISSLLGTLYGVHSPLQKFPPRIFNLSLGTAFGKENSRKPCIPFSVRLQPCHKFTPKSPLLNTRGLLSRQNPPDLLQLNFLSLSSRKSFYCSGL